MKAAATLATATATDAAAERLDAYSLDRIFRDARSYTAWQPRPVPQALLRDG